MFNPNIRLVFYIRCTSCCKIIRYRLSDAHLGKSVSGTLRYLADDPLVGRRSARPFPVFTNLFARNVIR